MSSTRSAWRRSSRASCTSFREHFEAGRKLSRYPFEMLDENKWLAARHGLEGELVDLPNSERVSTRALARRLVERMRDHCQDLGSVADLEAVEDLLERGNGAARQVVVYEANHDLREVMAEIVAAHGRVANTGSETHRCRTVLGPALQSACEHRWPGPVRDLQELRVGGEPVHHRVPVLRQPAAQARSEDRPRRARIGEAAPAAPAGTVAAAPAARRDSRDPRRLAAIRDHRAGRGRARRDACCGARRSCTRPTSP